MSKKFIDLTGRRFGRLIVLSLAQKGTDILTKWNCRCDCGESKAISSIALRTGHTKSCGCLRSEVTSKRFSQNLQGQKFGWLTVVCKVGSDKNQKTLWQCKCKCGNKTIVNTSRLRSGFTKSCGCYSKYVVHKNLFKDLTGMKFGKLTAISYQGPHPKTLISMWKCKCDCGKECTIDGKSLRKSLKNGITKSCGCYNSEQTSKRTLKDLTGKKFWFLTVLRRHNSIGSSERTMWLCKCKCGNETIVDGGNLKSNQIKSCGCFMPLFSRANAQNPMTIMKRRATFYEKLRNGNCHALTNGEHCRILTY